MDAHKIVFLGKDDPYTGPTLEFLWGRIVGDGLVPVVFYDGSVRCLEDFQACMQDSGTLPFVMSSAEGKIIMFCWLNCIEGVMARIHFTFFKDSWGRKRDALGGAKVMLRHVLTRRDSAGYVLDTVVGMTPVSNPLAVAHWRETEAAMYGEQAGVPITDTAWENMAALGLLHIVTAREGGELAGYAVFVLAENINMPGRVQASNLALYLAPGVRRDPFLAMKLLRWAEGSLRRRGVSSVAYISPVSRPCDALFRRLGAKMTETTWHKEL